MSIKRNAVYDKTHGRCFYCGIELFPDYDSNEEYMVIDHFLPRSRGGTDDFKNLVPSCRSCNSSKGTRPLERLRYVMTCKDHGLPVLSQKHLDHVLSRGYELPPLVEFYFEIVEKQKRAA